MVALKAHQADQALAKPDKSRRVILIYGPDTGLVIERANHAASNLGVDTSDPFSTIRLNAEDVADDKSRLVDEAYTVGMFGGERLIRVSGTTRKNLFDSVKPLLENPPADAWIIIEAGDLNNKSALRLGFEKSNHALAVPCYQDDSKAVDQLIREEITAKGQTISRDALDYLRPLLGGDRMASRNELQKLVLYTLGISEISLQHVMEIVGDASTFSVDDVIDAVSAGDMEGLEENLDRLLQEGLAPDMLVLGALRHFQMLHELRSRMEAGRQSASAVVDGARPPIFYKRKPLITKTISRLGLPVIEKVIQRFQSAAFEARANSELARAIAGTSMLAAILEIRAAQH